MALLGDAPRRRDLLIEHLHKIQDRFGCLSAAHLVALAAEMKMAMAEVYEVATFYHHFDVVKEGDTAPPAITVRVCDSIACDLAGSHELLKALPALLGARTSACCTRRASAAARRRRSPSSARIRCRTRRPRKSSSLVQARRGRRTPTSDVDDHAGARRLRGVPRRRRLRAGRGVRERRANARPMSSR